MIRFLATLCLSLVELVASLLALCLRLVLTGIYAVLGLMAFVITFIGVCVSPRFRNHMRAVKARMDQAEAEARS